jgi:hypothetical protein
MERHCPFPVGLAKLGEFGGEFRELKHWYVLSDNVVDKKKYTGSIVPCQEGYNLLFLSFYGLNKSSYPSMI